MNLINVIVLNMHSMLHKLSFDVLHDYILWQILKSNIFLFLYGGHFEFCIFHPFCHKTEIANIDVWIQHPQIRLKKYVGNSYSKMPVQVGISENNPCLKVLIMKQYCQINIVSQGYFKSFCHTKVIHFFHFW